MIYRTLRFSFSFYLGLVILFIHTSVFATQVIRTDLSQMIQKAGVVFSGVCLDQKTEQKVNPQNQKAMTVTTYTFSVEEWVKGKHEEIQEAGTFTFSQWGAPRNLAKKNKLLFALGQPQYEVGKRYFLFLSQKNATGLSAPIGLSQGVMAVEMKAGGEKVVKSKYLEKSLKSKPGMQKALSVPEQGGKEEVNLQEFLNILEEMKKQK